MRSAFVLVLCCVAFAGLAQTGDSLTLLTIPVPPDSTNHFLTFEVIALHDGDELRNDLVTGLWRGGWIDREMRQRSEGTAGEVNRAGYAIDGRISYSWGDALFGSDRFRPRLALAYHDVLGMRYANDLYHATFFGNGDHEDQTLEFAPSSFEKVTYQTFGFGVEHRRSRSYAMLHFVNGQSFSAADLEHADVYTATDGEYLLLDLQGDYDRSDTASATGFATNGMGAALSFELRVPIRLFKRPSTLILSGQDLGVIAWNDHSLGIEKDTLIRYDGIRVDDILNMDDILVGRDELQDSLGLDYIAGSTVRALPALLTLMCRVEGTHNMVYEAQADVRNLPGYLPHGVLSAAHTFAHRNTLRTEVSFGGFGGWRVGLGWQHGFGELLKVNLRTTNLVGLLSDQAHGRSAMLGIEMAW